MVGFVHGRDKVVSDDVGACVAGPSHPLDEPDDQTEDEQRYEDPADDPAALIHLSLLPGDILCNCCGIWIYVHFLKINQKILIYCG
jgi:hypothetical protein